ncbi:hypothetical protein QZH41_003932 [Actinostola sp. cb2023]|nr:hypothetical protein QZH41_003932 [Actinostola sp. cb2023]
MISVGVIIPFLVFIRCQSYSGDPASNPVFQWVMSISACIDGKAHLPVNIETGKCSDRSYRWISPIGTQMTRNTGKHGIAKDGELTIYKVQRSDKGLWKCHVYCTEGKKISRINLQVNCEHRFAYAGSNVILQYQKHKAVSENNTLKSKLIYGNFSSNPRNVLIVLNGKITNDGQKMFGKRLTIGPDGHTLKIEKIKEGEAGNYTFVEQWTNTFHNLKTERYTYYLIVKVAPEPSSSTTTTPGPTTYNHKTTAMSNATKSWNISTPPAGHGKVHGSATMLQFSRQSFLLLVSMSSMWSGPLT